MDNGAEKQSIGGHLVGRERWVAILSALAILGPPMLYSSPSYRRIGLLLAGIALVVGLWPRVRSRFFTGSPQGLVWVVLGLAGAHTAFITGGLLQGNPPGTVLFASLQGIIGVACVWLLTKFWLSDRWRPTAGKLLLGVLSLLLLTSLLGYFLSIEKAIDMRTDSQHFGPLRIALIWPLRALTMANGQMLWEHTNIAGFFFGLGFVILTGFLLQRRGGPALWWIAGGCLIAVFLTGSRSAWLMVFAGSAILLFGQPRERLVKFAALVLISVGAGVVGLKAKARAAETTAQQVEKSGHMAGLVKRGSSGRLAGYQLLWQELETHRLCGRGLAATNQPLGNLTHEHSIFMATLRGGGLLALAAHLTILAAAAWQAWLLYHRQGIRWPLAVLATVIAGVLFDRTTIFKLTGYHDFIIYWAAVLTPFVLTQNPSGDSSETSMNEDPAIAGGVKR